MVERHGARVRWAWLLVLGSVLLAGCGLGNSASSKFAQSAPRDAAAVATTDRKLISTATMRVVAKDVPGSVRRTADVAREAGGLVESSSESAGDALVGSGAGSITVRLPPDRLIAVMDAVAGLGTVEQRSTATQDVTEEYVDLEARLAAQKASADRLRELIGKAASVSDLLAAESELAKRTAEVEALEGKQRVLTSKTDLASLSVTFSPTPAAVEGDPGFFDGLRGGWEALVATASVLLVVLGALLPWAVPAGVLGFGSRLGYTRWRRTHPPKERPPRPPLPQWMGVAPYVQQPPQPPPVQQPPEPPAT